MTKERNTTRAIWIKRVIIFISVILVIQTGWLQLVDSTYGKKAERTTLVRRILYPGRGIIMDRNNHVMVHNVPVYDLKVIYNQVPKNIDTNFLCQLLEIDKEGYIARIEQDWKSPRFSKSVPFTFMGHIPADKFQYIQEYLHLFPGFFAELRSARGYFENHSSHILGYMSEVDQAKIDQSAGIYIPGDYAGSTGVENYYENLRSEEHTSELQSLAY